MKPPETTGLQHRVDHLFVVRVWREQTADVSDHWRGSVVHVTSGQTRYFANLADLAEFIIQQRDSDGVSRSMLGRRRGATMGSTIQDEGAP